MTGLDPRLRRLIAAKIAASRADWTGLATAIQETRLAAGSRADLEETLLQGTLFYGFPRTVTAFESLQREWPTPVAPSGGGLPATEHAAAGARLFAAIYGENSASVLGMLRSFHADFADFVLEAAYGRVLARPGLPPRERELLAVGALAALEQIPQLVAHARGAIGFGARLDEVQEAITLAVGAGRAAELMRRIRPRA